MGIKAGFVAEQGRAIGTDDLRRIAHVEKDMRVIERRLSPTHLNSRVPISMTGTPGVL